jgi:hypothetical protein
MKKYDIKIKGKPYVSKDGSEKSSYKTVGTLTEGVSTKTSKEYKILEMFMWPNADFSIFEQEQRVGGAGQNYTEPTVQIDGDEIGKQISSNVQKSITDTTDYGEVINPDDIPF